MANSDITFSGKVAVITGAAQGMGAAYARLLAAAGAAVVVSDIQLEKAQAVAASIIETGGQAIATRTDVSSPADCQACADAAIKAFGGIDLLVNNAGLLTAAMEPPLHKIDIERYLKIVAVVTPGGLYITPACTPSMTARGGGAIVNTSSIGAWQPQGVYSLTKLGVNGLTGILANELLPMNIRVNAVAPGPVDTEGLRGIMSLEQLKAYALASGKPTDEVAGPEDIARVGLFLLSDAARFVSGQVVAVDQATLYRI